VDKFALRPGLVIRYDFLWKSEGDAGREHGLKIAPAPLFNNGTTSRRHP